MFQRQVDLSIDIHWLVLCVEIKRSFQLLDVLFLQSASSEPQAGPSAPSISVKDYKV